MKCGYRRRQFLDLAMAAWMLLCWCVVVGSVWARYLARVPEEAGGLGGDEHHNGQGEQYPSWQLRTLRELALPMGILQAAPLYLLVEWFAGPFPPWLALLFVFGGGLFLGLVFRWRTGAA